VKVNPISGEPIMAYGSDSSEWQVGIDGNNYFSFSPLTHSTISGVSFNIVQGTESTQVTCPAFAPPAISCEQNYFDLTNWGAETIRTRCTTSGVVESVQIQGYGWIETTDNPNEFYYNAGAMPYCGDYQNEVIAEGMGHQASFDINTHIDCNARIDSTEQLCPQGLVFNGSYCGEAIDYGNIIVPFVPGQAGELEFPVTKFSDKVKLTGGSAPNGFKISCAEDSCKVSWTGSESWSDRIYVNYVIEDASGNEDEGSREEYLFFR
jgi:hypothetical protein